MTARQAAPFPAKQSPADVGAPDASLPKVLLVSTNADLAGAPSHVRDLVLGLRHAFRFTVVFGEDGPIRQRLADAQVRTIVLDGMRSEISPARDLRVVRALGRIIREEAPALIHAHSAKAGMVARLAGAFARVPVVYTVHGWGFGEGRPRLQGLILRGIETLLAPSTRQFISVSRADAALARRALRVDESRCLVIPNGVADTPRRAQPASHAGFVMVARTCFAKDHESALRAFGGVAGDHAFTCVGGGTDEPGFRDAVRRWAGNAASRVDLLGNRPGVDDILASQGIFVLSSRYEGMPLSIIEAMRSGLPVIATRVGGVAELVDDGVNGLLVDAGDVGAMRGAMQRLADDPSLRARLGAAGRARYEQSFSADRMNRRIADVYRTIGAGPRIGKPDAMEHA
ncbi:MAG: glycosyltransferase family 4 protein [Lautropia sp.]